MMTSAFDDEDFRGNFVNVNDFGDEEDDVMDNWEDELDEEEEAERKKKEKEAEEERKRKEKDKKRAAREEEKKKQEEIERLMNAPAMSKEDLEKAQISASQAAAADLFGFENDEEASEPDVTTLITQTSTLQLNNPDSIDTFVPVEPADFDELSRRIVKKLKKYEEDDGYSKFIRNLVPLLCEEMNSDNIKKLTNPLTNLVHEKSRAEKEAKRKAQTSSTKKISLTTTKKAPSSTNYMDDYLDATYDDFDDYGGDEFM